MRNHRSEFTVFQLIDRKKFDQLVQKWEMDKGIRSLTTWELTCALTTCMAMRLQSYREVEETLGIARSTLSDALNARFHGFFQDLCDEILLQIRGRTSDRKLKRGIREILAIDSSECRVHGSMFNVPNWHQKKTPGQRQASCKLHAVYSVNDGWVDDFKITGSRKHDSPISLQLELRRNKIYVFDRAYNDLDFWLKIIAKGSHFVTRLKGCKKNEKLQIKVLQDAHPMSSVLYDGFYQPSVTQFRKNMENLEARPLRHIIYRDPLTQKIFHFVTSDLKSTAQKIADIYKRRWAVELLFRWLKGHLDIRYLPAKKTNAIKIQIAVAVLTQLLLQLKKIVICFKGTLWELLRKIRASSIRQTLNKSTSAKDCRWTMPSFNTRDRLCF
jgi:putative transposase